ncbi:MAG: Ig-like domain-containing protein [Nitrososphaerales archaeon]
MRGLDARRARSTGKFVGIFALVVVLLLLAVPGRSYPAFQIQAQTETTTSNTGQGSGGAYFTSVMVTNGLGSSNLLSGGQSKVAGGQTVDSDLTYYNSNVGFFGADLYTVIYVDGTMSGTSSESYVWKGDSDSFTWTKSSLPLGTHNFEVQLWWDDSGTKYLEDSATYSVLVVQPSVSLTALPVNVPRGTLTPTDWTVTVSDIGSDNASNVVVSVTNAAGMTILPQSQTLGDIASTASKSTVFSITAPESASLGQQSIGFKVQYTDFEGNPYQTDESGSVYVTKTSTSLALSVNESTATVGDMVTLQATLTSNGVGVQGQTINFTLLSNATASLVGHPELATTDSSGKALAIFTVSVSPGAYFFQAAFLETSSYSPSAASVYEIVTAIPTKLTLSKPSTLTQGSGSTLSATLVDSKGNPIQGVSVQFLVNGTSAGTGTTDATGKASLSYTPNKSGTVQVQAAFQGGGNYGKSTSIVSAVKIATPGILGLGTTDTIVLIVVIIIVVGAVLFAVLRRGRKSVASSASATKS